MSTIDPREHKHHEKAASDDRGSETLAAGAAPGRTQDADSFIKAHDGPGPPQDPPPAGD